MSLTLATCNGGVDGYAENFCNPGLISAENSFYWLRGRILDIQPTSIDKPVGFVSKINAVVWQLKHMFRRATVLAGTTGRPTGPYSAVGRRSCTSTEKSVL
jgi:hypothetical protein